MLILNAHKKLYTLLICALLMAQPLKPMISDKRYTDAIFYLFFFGGCALLGILHSHLKKIDAKKPTITSQEFTKKSSQEELAAFKDILTRQEKRIEHLEQRCKILSEQNSQLLVTTKNMQWGINGYVPAFVAALWFHKYTEQTQIINNYKQNIPDKNYLALLNNQ